MPTVGELMKRDVLAIPADATLRDALFEMKKRGVDSLIIEKRSPTDAYGIITFADIAKAIVVEEGDIEMLNVFDVASKPAIHVSENMDVKYAVKLMLSLGFKQLLVIDNNELKGMLALTDAIYDMMDTI